MREPVQSQSKGAASSTEDVGGPAVGKTETVVTANPKWEAAPVKLLEDGSKGEKKALNEDSDGQNDLMGIYFQIERSNEHGWTKTLSDIDTLKHDRTTNCNSLEHI